MRVDYSKIKKRILVVPLLSLVLVGAGKNLEILIKEPIKQEIQIKNEEIKDLAKKKVQKSLKEYSGKRIEEENFSNDSEVTILARMLYGEARSVSNSEKISLAFTAINRANDGLKYNGESLKEAILAPKQYSCFNKKDSNFEKLKKPEKDEPKEWKKCLDLAKKILDGEYDKYNFGQTHYHRKGISPTWINGMNERLNSTGFKHQFYKNS
jgi:spore germination cell wall hydrolase CwlJ-like protein